MYVYIQHTVFYIQVTDQKKSANCSLSFFLHILKCKVSFIQLFRIVFYSKK